MTDSLDIGGRLLLLGAGKMGGAMLEGWLKLGLAPADVAVLDPHLPPEAARQFADRGIAVNPDLPASRRPPSSSWRSSRR